MRFVRILVCFLVVALPLGCRQPTGPPSSEPAATDSVEADLSILRYDTGDLKQWPDYPFQLNHTFEVPEVPPEIIGPFTAEDIPVEE